MRNIKKSLVPFLSVILLVVTSLACGSSDLASPTTLATTEQGQVSEQPTDSQPARTTEPTDLPESTDAPRPTDIPQPTDTPEPTDTPDPTATPIPETPDSPKGDGFYTVGEEIAPGKWHSTGTGGSCYWERLDASQDTLGNHFGISGGTIMILDTDYEVQLKNCGTWEYVEGVEQVLQSDAADSKDDGFYTVGVEIAPGKWESTGIGDDCYWERLDDYQETLGNHFGIAGGTINVLVSDYEVHFKECGAWEYVENMERVLQSDATDPKGDGFYTVGVEIAPGKWKSTGTDDSCYWERLDDYQDTLDNHYGNAGGTVTVLSSDYEAHFKECGDWEYVGP
ncbi:MAG: hypothetical protein GY832_06295 [Chloroflexi bacterium]|nr:hypothetical protein [Chloroflexota bacterium]